MSELKFNKGDYQILQTIYKNLIDNKPRKLDRKIKNYFMEKNKW